MATHSYRLSFQVVKRLHWSIHSKFPMHQSSVCMGHTAIDMEGGRLGAPSHRAATAEAAAACGAWPAPMLCVRSHPSTCRPQDSVVACGVRIHCARMCCGRACPQPLGSMALRLYDGTGQPSNDRGTHLFARNSFESTFTIVALEMQYTSTANVVRVPAPPCTLLASASNVVSLAETNITIERICMKNLFLVLFKGHLNCTIKESMTREIRFMMKLGSQD